MVLGGKTSAGAFSGEDQVEMDAVYAEGLGGGHDAREPDAFIYFVFQTSFFWCFV